MPLMPATLSPARTLEPKSVGHITATRVRFVLEALERRLRKDVIQRLFCDHFDLPDTAFATTHRLALDQLVENVSQDRDTHRAQALLTLEGIIRSKCPDIVKVRAQQVINRLLGLDDTNASNGNKVMPVIEVIVRNHGEAMEYQDMKKLLELQQQSIQIDARRLPLRNDAPADKIAPAEPQDSINTSVPSARASATVSAEPVSIEW